MEDPLWIVKILQCEGGDVERLLEPQNISWYLRLDLTLSTLNSLYLALQSLLYLYMFDIVCVFTLVF